MYDAAWAGMPFPNPEASWHSRFAPDPHSNNVTGMMNVQMDGLCNRFDREDDPQRRVAVGRDIDALLTAEVPYLLGWYNPAQRVLFWNKFGMPDWGAPRAHHAEADDLFVLWWINKDKEAAIEAAKTDLSVTMQPGRREVHFWQSWSTKHATGGSNP